MLTGADIGAAIALGARFILIDHDYLYGLMAGSRAGVDRAIDIPCADVERTMRVLGITALEELYADRVTPLRRLAPAPVDHHGER